MASPSMEGYCGDVASRLYSIVRAFQKHFMSPIWLKLFGHLCKEGIQLVSRGMIHMRRIDSS